MSTIYLLRHGALAENFGKNHYLGCHEVALSTQGRAQMAAAAHAGVNRVILSKLLNQSLDTLFKIKQDYGCINILELEGDIISCTTLNYTAAHLLETSTASLTTEVNP